MSVAAADPKHNVQTVRQNFYDKISKQDMTPLWEVLRNVVTRSPSPRRLRRSGNTTTSRSPSSRLASSSRRRRLSAACWCWRTPRCAARAAPPTRCSPASAHHAGRGRRRAQARLVRDPLRAGRRGRLHRGRGRESQHVARRIHSDAELGAARSRQPGQEPGVVARRARHADHQSLRDVVHGALRREGAEHQPRERQLAGALGSGVLPDGQTSTRSSTAAR